MADKAEVVHLLRSSWGDAVVLTATFLLTVFGDLTIAIGAGVTLSAFLFLHRMSQMVEVETGTRLVTEDVPDTADGGSAPYEPGGASGEVQVYRISGAFFFGTTAAISSVLGRIGERPQAFVLDLTQVPLVDSTAANALKSFALKLSAAGTRVYFAGASASVRRALRAGWSGRRTGTVRGHRKGRAGALAECLSALVSEQAICRLQSR